jgi:hypothetical protein
MGSISTYASNAYDDISLDPLGMEISLAPIIYLVIEGAGFVVLLFFIEKLKNT